MSHAPRLPALDALRGLAVLLMVLYHAAFDLRFFYGWPLDVFHGGWLLLAHVSAILFLLIAGACFALSWERTPPRCRLYKTLRRFAVLALAAALVSAATWLIAPRDFVKFGILHLFALATLLLPLFAPIKRWNALPALLILLLSFYELPIRPELTAEWPTTNHKLVSILLGSPPPSFSSLDYFPLVPWFGIILLGTVLGYSQCFHHALERSQAARVAARPVQIVGRHSLMIYLLHQPLLLAILSILLGFPLFR